MFVSVFPVCSMCTCISLCARVLVCLLRVRDGVFIVHVRAGMKYISDVTN